MLFNLSFAQKKELQTTLFNDKSPRLNKNINIELYDGTVVSGELESIDEKDKKVVIRNASDITEIDFKKIYKIHESDRDRTMDYIYRIDVPERFFYTPMGNTMDEGMVSLENYSFLNNSLKVGITKRVEAGIGFTLWPNDDEDSSVSVLPMINAKYKLLDRRHLKASIGFTSLQLPPIFTAQTGATSNRKPFFNVVYASANWEYKYATVSIAAAQPYLNTFALRKSPGITNNDDGIDYMFSSSFSIKVFPFAHFISENIFMSGAWNTISNPNRINRETYLVPLVGGRYYGDYYSFAGGVSNVLIPNAIFFFYIGGAYYFN